ncbi:hypothetical protein H4R26_001471 [Coemansia thaxteri]|uniref:JmjC domain-containing protein n=1 Tax=Coemansia thaxteri TaxID=2663907 RepID=A0A9W8BIG6_9FUNG|nr:hypothetical protein H4R26_001471 [Coemansia thaxteri]
MPIVLPGRRVAENANNWVEFHVLCMTVSAMKSLLRFELAVVRDAQIGESGLAGRGVISFHDTGALEEPATFGLAGNIAHPLFGCSPLPCMMRNIPLGSEGGEPVKYQTMHKKLQFIRASYYAESEMELMMCKVNRIVRYCDLLDKTQPASYSSISLCANELQLDDPNMKEDHSWADEQLDMIDKDSKIIAIMGDVDYGLNPTVYASSLDEIPGCITAGAGPVRSQSFYLEAEWSAKLALLMTPTRQPLEPWQFQPVYVAAGDLTLREFSKLWYEKYVVVVTGLLAENSQHMWGPGSLRKALGAICVPIYDMESKLAPMHNWKLCEFLKHFEDSAAHSLARDSETDCKSGSSLARLCAVVKSMPTASEGAPYPVKVTDKHAAAESKPKRGRAKAKAPAVPKVDRQKPAAESSKAPNSANNSALTQAQSRALEQTLTNAAALLPIPEYTSPNGQLNLISRLPTQYKKPELGPELQLAYGAQGEGGREGMRREAADIVNLMLYAGTEGQSPLPKKSVSTRGSTKGGRRKKQEKEVDSTESRVTEWDIYPPKTIDNLSDYFGLDDSEASGSHVTSGGARTQLPFMDDSSCDDFFRAYEDNSMCCRIYQKPGDAVFVPHGSVFQRRSFANTISVQSKFVSPESIGDTRQTSSIQIATKRLRRKEYLLPVMDVLWWTWMGQQQK